MLQSAWSASGRYDAHTGRFATRASINVMATAPSICFVVERKVFPQGQTPPTIFYSLQWHWLHCGCGVYLSPVSPRNEFEWHHDQPLSARTWVLHTFRCRRHFPPI